MLPTHLFLHQHLQHSAARRPDEVAISDVNGSLTYRALYEWALGAANGLQNSGVQPGDRVLLFMENSMNFAKAYWAVVLSGAVVTPLSPQTKPGKLRYIIRDCTPKAVIVDNEHIETVRAAAAGQALQVLSLGSDWDTSCTCPEGTDYCGADELIDQDLGCIIYTSGSTGHPKGVMLSHCNLVSAARSVSTYLGYRSSDRIFVAIPLTFDYGMHQLTMAALVGASVFVEKNFLKPLFTLDRLAKSKATVFPVVPTMVPMISALAGRFDLNAVRLTSSTASALDPKQIDCLSEVFPSATIFSMYGLTECHRCTYLPPTMLQERKSSVGIAIPNTELWVVDDAGRRQKRNATGELVIRGATVMKGYWNNPKSTAKRLKPGVLPGEFVFHTGDICRLDERGYVYFVSRMDDIINVKGEKVAPKEVEDALRLHPSVTEAIVFGRPDPNSGEKVYAAVIICDGAKTSSDALREWCADRLQPNAVPRTIQILEAFELNANGKIDRDQFHDNFPISQPSLPSKPELANSDSHSA